VIVVGTVVVAGTCHVTAVGAFRSVPVGGLEAGAEGGGGGKFDVVEV